MIGGAPPKPAAMRRRTISVCWSGAACPPPAEGGAVLGVEGAGAAGPLALSRRHRRRTTKAVPPGIPKGPSMTAGHLTDHPATSRSQVASPPRAREGEDRGAANAGSGELADPRAIWTSRTPARRGRMVPARKRSCSGATACASASARAASAWSGVRTTSSCIATSPSSASRCARRGSRAGHTRGARQRAPGAPGDRRAV